MEIPIKERLFKYMTWEGEFSFIIKDDIYLTKYIMSLNHFFSLVEKQIDSNTKASLLDLLKNPKLGVFAGSIYYLEKVINVKTSLRKIKGDLTRNLNFIIKENLSLINLIQKLEIKDIITLSEEGISFFIQDKNLYAIRYLPPYVQKYKGSKWKFPGCTIGIYIDNELRVKTTPYILKPRGYIHPFVFTDAPPHKICLGTFTSSEDSRHVTGLELVNKIIMLLATSMQILVSGYDRNVSPANGHLTDHKYDKYRIK
ncbi:MAG: hypothetical protein GF329_12965 [Candidatus Lokiarchaeota archaeon]|nr:hypothetical protein [Candidatus Lokiarchaeota archaeon]